MKNFINILAVLVLVACNEQQPKAKTKTSYQITGTIDTLFNNDYIYLKYANFKDSTQVKSGEFTFTGQVTDTVSGELSLHAINGKASLYVENSIMHLTMRIDTLKGVDGTDFTRLEVDHLTGSYTEGIQNRYATFYKENRSKPNFTELAYNMMDTMITHNKRNPFTGSLLAGYALFEPIFSKTQFETLYSKLDTTKQISDTMKRLKRVIDGMETYGVGNTIADAELLATEGNMVMLSTKFKKYTLIDFWASWCYPCRKANPDLLALYKELEAYDFTVIGVSRDDEKEPWLKAVAQDKLPWLNVIDIDKSYFKELDIVAVPYSYLVDEKGTILRIKPTITEIRNMVTGTSME